MTLPRYPKYKDSGVEWLGEVPVHWDITRLKRVAAVFPSNVDKKSYEDESHVKLCNYTDVYYNDTITENLEFMDATASTEQIAKFSLRAGDTVLTKDSETADDIAISAYVPRDLPGVVCGYHLSMVRPSENTHGAFIKWLFDSHFMKAQAEVSANGLTRVGLGQYALDNIYLALPLFEEQSSIERFLAQESGKIDVLVEDQQRLIELLKEKRQAVISHAVTKGLDPDSPMKDSGIEWLGKIPSNWSASPVKYSCSFVKDGTHLPPSRVDVGIPLLSVRNLVDGHFVLLDDDSMISEQDYLELCRTFVPVVGDVLLAIVGATLGKTAVIPEGLGQFYIQRSLAIFRTKGSEFNHRFLNFVFQSDQFQQLLWQHVGYSAQPGIYLGVLQNFRLPIPPFSEQLEIVAFLEREVAKFDTLTTEATHAIDLLQERRTALISAAVTGKIDVRGLTAEEAV